MLYNLINNAPAILPWLSLMVAIASAMGALYSVSLSRKTANASRKTARQQATLSFLEEYKNDKRIHKALAYVVGLKGRTGVYYDLLRNPADMENVSVLLNKYELLAVGLKHNVYDENIFIETLAVETIRVYQYCEPLIMEMRMENKVPVAGPDRQAFTGFEALAKEYKDRLAKK